MSIFKLLSVTYFIMSTTCFAQSEIWLPPKEPNPFSKSYLFGSVLQNIPVQASTDYFEKSGVSGELGYKFNMDLNWMVNVSIGAKTFDSTIEDSLVSLAYVSSGAEYVTRLSYPFYLTLGYKLYYFVATDGRSIPIGTNNTFSPELGFGISSSIYYIYNKKFLMFISLERWKGMGTRKLNGLETKFSIAYRL